MRDHISVRAKIQHYIKPAFMELFSHYPLRKFVCWRVSRSSVPSQVALTFDDGPDAKFTPRVLDILAENSLHATFFVVGAFVEKYPALFQRIVDEGHEIGIHCYVQDSIDIDKQVVRTAGVLRQFGVTSSLFRPPHGLMAMSTRMWMVRNHFTTVMWSFDCYDSLRYEGEDYTRRPLDEISAGDIILLHDDNPMCIADLVKIIDTLKEKQLKTQTITEMMAFDRFLLDP